MNFLPVSDGAYLLTGHGRTKKEIAKFFRQDAESYEDFCTHLDRIADALRVLVLKPPPNVATGLSLTTLRELVNAASMGKQLNRLGLDGQQELLDILTLSAAEFLDRWFESEPIKALLGFDSIVGTYASPFDPGTAYVLLHHAFGEVNGKKGVWGHAVGGMGAISDAIAEAAAQSDVDPGKVHAEIRHGDPRATIVDAGADDELIVLGARGRTGVASWVLGSLADYALQHTQGSLVIWRDRES